jgi:hypothetical protein
MAIWLRFGSTIISDNPGEETRMPATRPVERPTMTPEQINLFIEAIEDPHDMCLMCIGLFCATPDQ